MQAHHQSRNVERIGSISRSTFEQEYLAPQQPVILTEPATQWQAVQKWSLTYLQSVLGDHHVVVECYPSGRRSDALTYEDMSLGDYIQRVCDDQQARRQYYLAEEHIAVSETDECPSLAVYNSAGRNVVHSRSLDAHGLWLRGEYIGHLLLEWVMEACVSSGSWTRCYGAQYESAHVFGKDVHETWGASPSYYSWGCPWYRSAVRERDSHLAPFKKMAKVVPTLSRLVEDF